ncbi:MAG: glycosyltransferase family 39 protein [Bryobacteraceae bacterium]
MVSSGMWKWVLVALAFYFLLFFGLSGMGLVGPDEPRYASIGREMASSGDWITPRLWGAPWFEKPAILYWMIGIAFRLGLSEDVAPRLPVALASLAFLIFYYRLLRREFDAKVAAYASLMLATSAGWLAYSQIAATDLPMSAAFAAAQLLALGWIERGERRGLLATGILMGIAVLAKGLVPLLLAVPMGWINRRRWRDLLWPVAAGLLVALPWYAAVTWRHGWLFLNDFFGRHHFQRFSEDVLMHQQPFWFYVPVLLAGLFPWTPMLVPVFNRRLFGDRRARFLAAWVLFGLVFFSASANKLPGYLLPLLPAVTALAGLALARLPNARWYAASVGILLGVLPVAARVLPGALAVGLSRAGGLHISAWVPAAALGFAALCWWLENGGRRAVALAMIGGALTIGVVALKIVTYPAIDQAASARPLWREIEPHRTETCVDQMHRSWRYGLNYYSITPLADCAASPQPYRVAQEPGKAPRLLGPIR